MKNHLRTKKQCSRPSSQLLPSRGKVWLVTKTLEGRSDEVVECTSCLQCFMPSEDPGMTCQVNDNI